MLLYTLTMLHTLTPGTLLTAPLLRLLGPRTLVLGSTAASASAMEEQMERERGEKGARTGRQAKLKLREQQRHAEEEHARNIETLILETSKTSALRAVNLNQLLKKKWTEERNAYKLLTSIKTDKEDRRVKNLLRKHAF